ncbi:GNAT family N-acetyltransferase [Solihabitans fulvus]|nr:GNAT family N-acetyltransferase [Solihabitans fulvus]
MMVFRLAVAEDLPQLEILYTLCFPVDNVIHKPSAPSELPACVAGDLVQVCAIGDRIVAFAQLNLPIDHHLYINAVAVHPEFRQQGLGGHLLDNTLNSEYATERSISAVASPDNLAMLRLLFSRRFIVRTIMYDYCGFGVHRFYLQHKSRRQYVDPDERFIVPLTSWSHLSFLLQSDDHVITAAVPMPSGPAFEVSRFEREDVALLQSDESQSGVNFAGTMLAAITFVLGFSFASSNYPDDVRILLIGAAFASTMALVVYANASGELSRIRSNNFGNYMKLGNTLSEYGGVLPFLISLPATFSQVASSAVASFTTAAASTLALYFYMHSRFSIAARFTSSLTLRTLQILVCLAPVTGVLATKYSPVAWPWTATTTVLLASLAYIHIYRRPSETALTASPTHWTSRR